MEFEYKNIFFTIHEAVPFFLFIYTSDLEKSDKNIGIYWFL